MANYFTTFELQILRKVYNKWNCSCNRNTKPLFLKVVLKLLGTHSYKSGREVQAAW